MGNVSPVGLPEGLPDGQDEPEPDSLNLNSSNPDNSDKDQPVPSAGFGIDIQCDDARWQPYLGLVETRLGALAHTLALPAHGEVSVKLTDDPVSYTHLTLPTIYSV